MKASYKQKLFLCLFLLFSLFTFGIIVFEQSREKKLRTEALEGKLDVYANMINAALIRHQTLDSLLLFFPPNIRLTLIDKQGLVLYDNALEEITKLENHALRPEIISAKKEGTGTNIRTSSSNKLDYLYYAKRFDNQYVRVALPYDIQVQHFLKPDNLFLYYILILFAVLLLLVNYVIEGKKQIALEREKLLQHVHSSEEGLCFFSANKTIEFYNGLFIQYLNTITDESNTNPLSLFTDLSFHEAASFLTGHKAYKSYFETRVNKQGKTFAVRINIFEDNSFEFIINDITKQEKTRLLKQEMTGNIAHELRTPVTSIRGYLETLLEQSMNAGKHREFLTKAYNQSVVLSELIHDMSLITKIEEAPQSFPLEPVRIRQLIETLKADLEFQLQEKNIQMKWNIPDSITITGNRHLLYSIFRNLTDNVIRHAGTGVRIFINQYNEDSDSYYFSYSDTGVGIPDDYHLNRLFERFYRINEGRTRDAGGSGLGLSIVKNAVLFHKGSIVAKNRAGGGLEFLFKLPKKVKQA
ncbi:Alkaline phosphatase synthesis sensor protein phoR [Bacteroidales bacterium Barb6]|nr:Alkaline phosphatase synthesis sensor protein phoR [Bacteroidales bacterium Barb6]